METSNEQITGKSDAILLKLLGLIEQEIDRIDSRGGNAREIVLAYETLVRAEVARRSFCGLGVK